MLRNQGNLIYWLYHGQSNSIIHTITMYFASSFTDSIIQDNVETHAQEIINEGITQIIALILIMPLIAWAADFQWRAY